MFGHKVNEGKTGATFNKDDQAKYVGMGWISVEKVDGVRKFIGNVLYKVKFSEPSEDYSTKVIRSNTKPRRLQVGRLRTRTGIGKISRRSTRARMH